MEGHCQGLGQSLKPKKTNRLIIACLVAFLLPSSHNVHLPASLNTRIPNEQLREQTAAENYPPSYELQPLATLSFSV